MAAESFSKTGTKSSAAVTLPEEIFALEVASTDLLKQAYVAYEANARQRLAQVKSRGEVRGGGRKPWRQKGTGRARVGSTRSPLWRTGGVIFGPTDNRNFSKKLNKKAALKALKQALSLAVKEGRIAVIDSFDSTDGKTAAAAKVFTSMNYDRGVVLVCENPSENVTRSVRNIPFVALIAQPNLTVYDVLRAHHVVFTKDAIKALETRLKETA